MFDFLRFHELPLFLNYHGVRYFCLHFLYIQEQPLKWNGELSKAAETILHQHAIQGDITAVQQAVWYVNLNLYIHIITFTFFFINIRYNIILINSLFNAYHK